MIIRGQSLICVCDHWTGGETLSDKTHFGWKMWEISFGVDPEIVSKNYREKQETVVVIKDTFHFCEQHKVFYEDLILGLIARAFPGEISEICTSAHLEEKLGCWITVIDVFGGLPVRNFQLPYEVFRKIYAAFLSLPFDRYGILAATSIAERVRRLRRL